jgi:hypothetical protein
VTRWQYKDETGRVCSKCETYKPWDQFNKGQIAGHRPECRQCQKRIARSYHRDPVKSREAVRRWYQNKKAKRGSNDVPTTET